MTAHDRLDQEAGDRAALYALGALPEEESRRFRDHLPVCRVCREEVEALGRVTEELSALGPRIDPPEDLKRRLMDRIRKPDAGAAAMQGWKSWTPAAPSRSMSFSLERDACWEPAGVPGVDVRRLHVDPSGDRVTMLVRMAPGAAYPSHRHGGAEECYVVSGDLHVEGGRRMRAGDYQHAPEGSLHGVQSTRDGCLLLIVSSTHDEILPPTAG